jgi:Flp pilus assembly protein TadD
MRALRTVLALLVSIAALALIARGVTPRIACNRDKGRINREVRRFERTGDENGRTTSARNNVIDCRRCLAIYPEDFQLHMLMGANLRVLGDAEGALQSYRRALAIAERPEMYAQMAEIEIERGDIVAARALMLTAASFNTRLLETVDEPMRSDIAREVFAKQERLRAARN